MEKPMSNSYRPVSLQFANIFGANPVALPIPGERSRYGVNPPCHADSMVRYMLPDGSIWEYKGISAYAIDDKDRVRGWDCIWRPI